MTTITLIALRGGCEWSPIVVPPDRVYLGGQGIVQIDLSPLADCEELELLWLYDNCLDNVDLEPLRHCPRLRSLSLRANRLASVDLSPLSHCSCLEELDLSDNGMTVLDISPLASCTSLRQIDFSGNALVSPNLYALQNCTRLSRIVVGQGRNLERDDDSCRSGSSPVTGDRAEVDSLDVTPLFWINTLTDVELEGNMQLRVDPALRYIAAAKALGKRSTILPAPQSDSPPALKWMTQTHYSRLTVYDYESEAERVGILELKKRLDAILSIVPQSHWFHMQKGLLEGLGLGNIAGFDGNPALLSPLEDSSSDFSGLKQFLLQRMIELLRDQVKRKGATLFINIGFLLALGEPELANAVINLRQEEMDSLVVPVERGQADISELMLTSYGHSLLSALGERRTTIPVGDLNLVADELAKAGFQLRPQERKVTAKAVSGPRVTQSLIDFVLVDRLDRLTDGSLPTESRSHP